MRCRGQIKLLAGRTVRSLPLDLPHRIPLVLARRLRLVQPVTKILCGAKHGSINLQAQQLLLRHVQERPGLTLYEKALQAALASVVSGIHKRDLDMASRRDVVSEKSGLEDVRTVAEDLARCIGLAYVNQGCLDRLTGFQLSYLRYCARPLSSEGFLSHLDAAIDLRRPAPREPTRSILRSSRIRPAPVVTFLAIHAVFDTLCAAPASTLSSRSRNKASLLHLWATCWSKVTKR